MNQEEKIIKNKYFIPYQGSKEMIIKKIFPIYVEQKPLARYFVDFFGGGGALSFEALKRGYKVIYNENNNELYCLVKFLFVNCRNQLPEYWFNWVGRDLWNKICKDKNYEDLSFIKDETEKKAYIFFLKICWSFGHNKSQYMYGKEIAQKEKEKYLTFMYGKKEGFLYDVLKYIGFDYLIDELLEIKDVFLRKTYYTKIFIVFIAFYIYKKEGREDLYKEHIGKSIKELFCLQQTKEFKKIEKYFPQYIVYFKNGVRFNIDTLEEEEKKKILSEILITKNIHNIVLIENKLEGKLDTFSKTDSLSSLYLDKNITNLASLSTMCRLQNLVKLKHLLKPNHLSNHLNSEDCYAVQDNFFVCNKSYDELDWKKIIKEIWGEDVKNKDVILVTDPPYFNTTGYDGKGKKSTFDFERFYNWIEFNTKQGNQILCHEYTQPRGTFFVHSIDKRKALNGANTEKKKECIFTNIKHKNLFEYGKEEERSKCK